jgi:hypothetical protein
MEGVHKLIESQSGRQMLVWDSPGCTRYVFQLKDHIMKSEKKIICIRSIRKRDSGWVKGPHTSMQIANAFSPSAIFVAVQNCVS